MLEIDILINRNVKCTVEVVNINPSPITNSYKGDCPYVVQCNGLNIGFVVHNRGEGLVHLTRKVMDLVSDKIYFGEIDTKDLL